MGQQSIILVFLSSVLLGIAVFGFMDQWQASTETTASQFEQEQSLNAANSGVNLALSKLRQQKTWRTGYSNLAVDRARVNLTVTTIGLDSVRIVSNGTYGDATSRVVVIARLASVFPTVQSALAIYGDTVTFTNAGKSFLIDGKDYNAAGTAYTTNPAVWGIGVQKAGITGYLKTQLTSGGIAPNVIGQGSNPSVGTFSADSLKVLRDLYASMATRVLAPGKYSGNAVYGSLASPEILHIPGDLDWNGTMTGTGILVVDGQLEFKGNVQWTGIVIAMAGGVVLDFGASGNPKIIGTAMIGNNNAQHLTQVHVNGNPSVKYSNEAVSTVLANLDLLAVKVLAYYE